MPVDANDLLLAWNTTKTATFNSASKRLGASNTPRQLLFVEIHYNSLSHDSGTGTWTFTAAHSSDDGTFYTLASAASKIITITTTAQKSKLWLPVLSDLTQPYIRFTGTLGAGSTNPTMKVGGYLTPIGPPS